MCPGERASMHGRNPCEFQSLWQSLIHHLETNILMHNFDAQSKFYFRLGLYTILSMHFDGGPVSQKNLMHCLVSTVECMPGCPPTPRTFQ